MAVAGNVTALCMYLISGNCSRYASPTGFWAATPSQAQCEGFFAGIQNGTDTDASGNTIGCRQNYAKKAETAGSEYYCQYAGLTGGGVCGVPLNNTCNAITTICPSQYGTYDACYADLSTLNGTFGSLQGPSGQSENTLECRTYHATASVLDPVHCGHVTAGAAPCHANDNTGAPKTNGSHYCGLIELTCTGNKKQFFGDDAATQWKSCSAIWNTWPAGNATFGASTPDQAGHQYHVFANANGGGNTVHCAHAGPSGGGVVGTTYVAWQQTTTSAACTTNASWVAAQVGQALAQWATLLPSVVPMDTDAGNYNVPAVSAAGANTETCRIYHLTAAATGAVSHCSHGSILGGGQCPLNHAEIPFCSLQAAACPGNYANAQDCATAFGPYFDAAQPQKMGDPSAMMSGMPASGDTGACRLYYLTFAATQKSMMNTTNATLCGNAKVAGSPACGAMMAPTSGAAFVSLSIFSSLMMLLW